VRYQHYKGGNYAVLQLGALSEDDHEPMVVYQSEKDGQVWVRPYNDFFAYVEGHGPRFRPAPEPRMDEATMRLLRGD
jgi:hypothetical protein